MSDCGHDHHSHIYHHFYGGDDGGGDESRIKAFLCVVGGFLLMVLLFMGLGAEVEDIPAVFIVIVWIAIASGLVALFMRK